jgi:hypothetical protein
MWTGHWFFVKISTIKYGKSFQIKLKTSIIEMAEEEIHKQPKNY